MSKIRWHQNENVYWADFRPNYRTQDPQPPAHPGNAAPAPEPEVPSEDRDACISRLERRIDSVLLDMMQGQERLMRALADHDTNVREHRDFFAEVRQVLSRYEAGLAERSVVYTRELAAIRERIDSIEKHERNGWTESVVRTLGWAGPLLTLHLAAGLLPGRDLVRHTLGSDYNVTTTEAIVERSSL